MVDPARSQFWMLRDVVKHVDDGVVIADRTENYTFVNSAAERIFGKPAQELAHHRNAESYAYYLPDGVTPFPVEDLPLARAIRRGESSNRVEILVRSPDETEGRTIVVKAGPLRDRQGRIVGGFAVVRDLGDYKEIAGRLQKTVDELEFRTRLMNAVFDTISEAVIVADENENYLLRNASTHRMFGPFRAMRFEKVPEDYGLHHIDGTTPVLSEDLPLARAIRKGESTDNFEMFVREPETREGFYISVSARPLRDETGATKGGAIVISDITEVKKARTMLSEAFAQGQLEVIDSLLHNVGNAVNSVATGIGTARELLEENRPVRRLSALADALEAHRSDLAAYLNEDPQGAQVIPFLLALVEDLHEHNTRLARTVDRVDKRVQHIVDIIRTQKALGGRPSARKEVGLRQAIDHALEILRDSIAKRQIEVCVECDEAPSHILIEESRFHQLLVNLVKNAIEAIEELAKARGADPSRTARPCIRIKCCTEGDHLVLDVIDNGVGISPEHYGSIFSPGFTTKANGSGLGLHSSANFVTASGGRIQPFSDGAGKGATMRIRLRLSTVLPAIRHTDAQPSLPGPGKRSQMRGDG